MQSQQNIYQQYLHIYIKRVLVFKKTEKPHLHTPIEQQEMKVIEEPAAHEFATHP
jgi:hypothetical protein